MVVLHEHEIRKTEGAFKFLFNKDRRDEFMSDLSAIIEAAEFTLVASVIRKDQLKGRVDDSTNLYRVALRLGLETVHQFLTTKGQQDRMTYVVCKPGGIPVPSLCLLSDPALRRQRKSSGLVAPSSSDIDGLSPTPIAEQRGRDWSSRQHALSIDLCG